MNGNTDIRDLMIQIEKARKQLVQPFLQNLGLTLGQGHARILNCLLEEDHLTQTELAGRCRMDTTTMSRSLDKLEKPDIWYGNVIRTAEDPFSSASRMRGVRKQFRFIRALTVLMM